jgi:hypothetical protein
VSAGHLREVADLVERWLAEHGPSSLDDVRAGVGKRRADVVAVLADASRFQAVEGPGRAKRYACAAGAVGAVLAVPGPAPVATPDVPALALAQQLANLGTATATSLTLHDSNPDFDQVEALAALIGGLHDMTAWWAGDLLLYSEKVFGQRAYQLAEAFRRSPETLKRWAWTCRQVPRGRSRPALSFSTHTAVAALPPAEQEQLLYLAEGNGWSVREVESAARVTKRRFNVERDRPEVKAPELDDGGVRPDVVVDPASAPAAPIRTDAREADVVVRARELVARYEALDADLLEAVVDAHFATRRLFDVEPEPTRPEWA